MSDAREIKVGLLPEAAQLLWAVSFDDDDLSGDLLDMFILSGASKMIDLFSDLGDAGRIARIRKLEREVRIKVLQAEEATSARMLSYCRPYLRCDDEPPF